MKQAIVALLLALFALAAPATAQTFPANNGSPVVDQAGILTPAQVADLQAKAQTLYTQTGRAFAVATVKSLENYDVNDYAYRLGRAWKLGSAKEDDGVLLLVAPNDRKVAIATGYGAGSYMTDALSGIIIRENILPYFKQNPPDYGAGIEAGSDAIIKQMTATADVQQANVAKAEQAKKQRQQSGGSFLPVIFWFFVIGFIILSHFRRASGRRYRGRGGSGINPWVVLWGLNELSRGSRSSGWSGGDWGGGSGWGGGGGGGFGGFGGGSFGGGGASGSW
ncbi:TPM domain-containing protein [Sphingomonas flavescens]|uniref:TPM domain-containing protein n=1 Tax=Sphingomonas flavescens TaxID=3132797 RepID=UPI002803DF13|nr:TPM domain-containing protein [Sphingomonas limnosediminicola]